MKFQFILFSTLIILFAATFSAWGIPQPESLGTNHPGERLMYISGKDFGPPGELADTPRTVESAAGLKSCVLLAEYQVLDQCKNLTVLRTIEWGEKSITTELRKPLPTDPEKMYLYIFDDEGGVSYPVGPLNIEEGIPSSHSHWGLEEFENEDMGSVIILELSVPTGPGVPGKPTPQ